MARGLTGLSYVQHAPVDSLTAQAWRRLRPRFEAGSRPRISEERWLNSTLQSTYNGSGIQFLPTPRSSTFDLFDKGRGSGGVLSLVNRQTGQEYSETIRIPTRYFYPVSTSSSFVGHLLPLGTLGAVHGVSLLDREVAWTTTPPGLASRSEVVRVGPAGQSYATFQCRQQLFVLDPANGELLWQRTDLESLTGLMADTSCGLFGDQKVLAVFAADRSHYTLYETATGAELCRGRLDADRRQPRRAFGRFLAYLTNTSTDRRLRIWDPLYDHLLLDEPADALADISLLAGVAPGTKAYQFVRGADELAYVTTDNRLKIVDVRSGESRLQLPLPNGPASQLGHLRVCTDGDRYYVNVHDLTAQANSPQTTFVTSDTTLPAEHFQGTLCVVDRHSGDVLWTRAVGNRTLLHIPEFRLPYLVTLCVCGRGTNSRGKWRCMTPPPGNSWRFMTGCSPTGCCNISTTATRRRWNCEGRERKCASSSMVGAVRCGRTIRPRGRGEPRPSPPRETKRLKSSCRVPTGLRPAPVADRSFNGRSRGELREFAGRTRGAPYPRADGLRVTAGVFVARTELADSTAFGREFESETSRLRNPLRVLPGRRGARPPTRLSH